MFQTFNGKLLQVASGSGNKTYDISPNKIKSVTIWRNENTTTQEEFKVSKNVTLDVDIQFDNSRIANQEKIIVI